MMTCIRRTLGVVLGVAVLACILACGNVRQAAAKAQRQNEMRQLGLEYHNFVNSKTKGPANADEFATFIQNSNKGDPAAPGLAAQVRSGQVVFYWGVRIPGDFPQSTTNTVLGYESKVPSSGGWVIMGDGAVREMTAGEYASASKPSKGGDKK